MIHWQRFAALFASAGYFIWLQWFRYDGTLFYIIRWPGNMCLVISVFLPIWDNNHHRGGNGSWERATQLVRNRARNWERSAGLGMPTAASAILVRLLLTGTTFSGGLDLSTRAHSSPLDWCVHGENSPLWRPSLHACLWALKTHNLVVVGSSPTRPTT